MSHILQVKDAGLRLDKRLTTQFPYSRNFFHHIIERKGIKKLGKAEGQETILKKSYKVKTGDKIFIDDLQRFMDGGILEEATRVAIPILYETPDYVIINKAKGILSHPNSIWDVQTPSVVARAYNHYKQQITEDPTAKETLPTTGNFMRAGLIHRLDRETDGVMVVAKTEEGMAHFKNLFQQKSSAETIEQKEAIKLKKYYRAVCEVTEEGKVFLEDIQSDLPHYIIKDVIPNTPHPVVKEGITKVMGILDTQEKNVGDEKELVTLHLEILTGRTHQIRYHLSSLGLPIVGDYLYNPNYTDESGDKLQLTSFRLEFEDSDGTMRTCEIT